MLHFPQLKAMEQDGNNVEEWITTICAYTSAGETETAYEWFRKAAERFPDNAMLYAYGGDLSRALGKTGDAFAYWDRSIELDDTFLDAWFSKGFCHEELGEYEKAYAIWTQLADRIRERGLTYETEFPLKLAEKCAEKIREKQG